MVIWRNRTGAGCNANASLSAPMAGAFGKRRPQLTDARIGPRGAEEFRVCPPVDGKSASPPHRRLARRAEFASSSAFPQQTVRKRLIATPSLLCQAPEHRPVRPAFHNRRYIRTRQRRLCCVLKKRSWIHAETRSRRDSDTRRRHNLPNVSPASSHVRMESGFAASTPPLRLCVSA